DLSQAQFSWPVGGSVAQACHTSCHLPHAAACPQDQARMCKVVLKALKEPAETLTTCYGWSSPRMSPSRKERPFLGVGPVLSPYPKEEVTQ
ncbi:hypothetical protein DBR06_SOUSAS6310031, partial [Sousa chinensis]